MGNRPSLARRRQHTPSGPGSPQQESHPGPIPGQSRGYGRAAGFGDRNRPAAAVALRWVRPGTSSGARCLVQVWPGPTAARVALHDVRVLTIAAPSCSGTLTAGPADSNCVCRIRRNRRRLCLGILPAASAVNRFPIRSGHSQPGGCAAARRPLVPLALLHSTGAGCMASRRRGCEVVRPASHCAGRRRGAAILKGRACSAAPEAERRPLRPGSRRR